MIWNTQTKKLFNWITKFKYTNIQKKKYTDIENEFSYNPLKLTINIEEENKKN